MAKIIGTSDAWKSVCLALNRANFKPEKPSDIHVFLETTKKEYALAKANATQEIQNKIEELKKDIEQREKNFDAEIQRGRDEISTNIKSTQIALRLLQGSFIQRIFYYFKIRKHREKVRYLKAKYNKFPRLVQKRIDQLKDVLKKNTRKFWSYH